MPLPEIVNIAAVEAHARRHGMVQVHVQVNRIAVPHLEADRQDTIQAIEVLRTAHQETEVRPIVRQVTEAPEAINLQAGRHRGAVGTEVQVDPHVAVVIEARVEAHAAAAALEALRAVVLEAQEVSVDQVQVDLLVDVPQVVEAAEEGTDKFNHFI